MSQFFALSRAVLLLLLLFVLMSSFQISQAISNDELIEADSRESAEEEQQRRIDDFRRLRHFLLTSNADERAARREEGHLYKRKLIREYLQSINDPDPDRLIEMKKRWKTFCHSLEDLVDSNLAPCG